MKHESLLTGLAGLALGAGATLLMVDQAGDPPDAQLDIKSTLSREQVDQIETRAAKLDEKIQLATEKITDRDARILEHAIGILYQEQYTMLEQLFEQKHSMMDMINMNAEIKKSTVE